MNINKLLLVALFNAICLMPCYAQVVDSNAVSHCKETIRTQPSSPLNLMRVKNLLYTEWYETIMPIYDSLPNALKRSERGQKVYRQIEGIKNTSAGAMAPELELPDVSGKMVKLSAFRGKVTLLDMWASWCMPCRKLIPQMRRLHDKYANNDFAIVSVSLDRSGARNAWLNAIKDEKMDWTQLSDLKGWDSIAAHVYGISAIPQYYLISADGRILAKNLPMDVLDRRIEKLLNRPNATEFRY